MTLNIKLLGDRIVAEPLEEVVTFANSQLVLPDTAKEKPHQSKVLALGPGRLDDDGERISIEVKVGDTIVYAKCSGTSFKAMDGKEILFMKESDMYLVNRKHWCNDWRADAYVPNGFGEDNCIVIAPALGHI